MANYIPLKITYICGLFFLIVLISYCRKCIMADLCKVGKIPINWGCKTVLMTILIGIIQMCSHKDINLHFSLPLAMLFPLTYLSADPSSCDEHTNKGRATQVSAHHETPNPILTGKIDPTPPATFTFHRLLPHQLCGIWHALHMPSGALYTHIYCPNKTDSSVMARGVSSVPES